MQYFHRNRKRQLRFRRERLRRHLRHSPAHQEEQGAAGELVGQDQAVQREQDGGVLRVRVGGAGHLHAAGPFRPGRGRGRLPRRPHRLPQHQVRRPRVHARAGPGPGRLPLLHHDRPGPAGGRHRLRPRLRHGVQQERRVLEVDGGGRAQERRGERDVPAQREHLRDQRRRQLDQDVHDRREEPDLPPAEGEVRPPRLAEQGDVLRRRERAVDRRRLGGEDVQGDERERDQVVRHRRLRQGQEEQAAQDRRHQVREGAGKRLGGNGGRSQQAPDGHHVERQAPKARPPQVSLRQGREPDVRGDHFLRQLCHRRLVEGRRESLQPAVGHSPGRVRAQEEARPRQEGGGGRHRRRQRHRRHRGRRPQSQVLELQAQSADLRAADAEKQAAVRQSAPADLDAGRGAGRLQDPRVRRGNEEGGAGVRLPLHRHRPRLERVRRLHRGVVGRLPRQDVRHVARGAHRPVPRRRPGHVAVPLPQRRAAGHRPRGKPRHLAVEQLVDVRGEQLHGGKPPQLGGGGNGGRGGGAVRGEGERFADRRQLAHFFRAAPIKVVKVFWSLKSSLVCNN